MSIETSIAALVEDETGQPYPYRAVELVEPDWTRFPGWKDVTAAEWESVQWQRSHCVKNLKQLREVLGDLVDERFYADLERDQAERATMSMLVPPQMLNTMAPHVAPRGAGSLTDAFYADPVRHYMLPVFSDRRTDWPSHPHATRDSLHEHDMWAVEGLTHRYPTKVLAELLPTCPQYCGHCTRMDLVGNSTPTVEKLKLTGKPNDRLGAMIDYLRRTPSVRDVVVSGGDVANMPWPRLEAFLTELLTVENIRDVRLATKALIGMPQHWLQPEVVEGVHRVATLARSRGVSLAMHTHANHANSVTPLVARGAKAMLDAGADILDVGGESTRPGAAPVGIEDEIAQMAKAFGNKANALFLARGAHYPIALEGALKLKEISYIHAEAYPAGELKHGPLALVDEHMPIVAVAPNDALLEKLKSNLAEVRARGGRLFVFADPETGFEREEDLELIHVAQVDSAVAPIVFTLPMQLLAYHAALIKGTDVDKPRNLAKSVTVE